MPTPPRAVWAAALLVFHFACQPSAEPEAEPAADLAASSCSDYACCSPYQLPGDLASQTQQGADAFSWQTFLALNAGGGTPEWNSWSSTDDLINCNQDSDPAGGTCENGRFYPTACQQVDGYAGYRVLDQVGKVDDEFEEAQTKGLSADPVIASNGTFLRYHILLSPDTFTWITGFTVDGQQGLQKEATLQQLASNGTAVDFPCSDASQPSQSIFLKLAWMDVGSCSDNAPADSFSENFLVLNDSYRNSTGTASCSCRKMALVGMHVVRKTATQRAWVWSTFEHANNAPDCTALPANGTAGNSTQNENCSSTASRNWNFYPQSCQAAGSSGQCQGCNQSPAQNGGSNDCVNPEASNGGNWCLDQPPAATSGYSRLCRQIPPDGYYSGAASWDETPPNAACQPQDSVWGNYQLITTQWATGLTGTSCSNVQAQVFNGQNVITGVIQPKSPVTGTDGQQRPYLGNSSMESYERPDCMGCHSKSTIDETDASTPGTDFIYFLGLEVPDLEAAGGN